ncbi:MAG: hypothetical protein PHV33_07375 [Elusimicrobiales bacterium]|nr:hypothetical protein [Elusimicrobiales bacterium]
MDKLLFAVLLTLSAHPVSAQLSEHDQVLIKECSDNIDPGKNILSPMTAAKCVRGLNEGSPESLISRYSELDSAAAGRLIGNNNALLDLHRIMQNWDSTSYIALARVLKTPDCALCDMGLGPQPEAMFKWIGRYAGNRLSDVRHGVLTWDVEIKMSPSCILLERKGKAAWDGMNILARRYEMHNFMFAEDKNKIPSAADKKGKELSAAGARLAAISPGGEGNYLAQTFDNAAAIRPAALLIVKPLAGAVKPGAGTIKAPKPVAMTAEQKELSTKMLRMEGGKPAGYMAEVMGQTVAGKRALAFYSDPKYAKTGSNKLNLAFAPGSALGLWNAERKVIELNSGLAEEFAAKRGMTVAQVIKNNAAMKDLAVYLSPTMVHEAEHQNQTARAIAAGIAYKDGHDLYTRAKENLSNKESSEHTIEYCSKNGGPACYAKLHPVHINNAEKFMEGGLAALDTLKAPYYTHIDSFEGGAAREFKMAQRYAVTLRALEAGQRALPAGLPPAQKKLMKDYRELMDTRFKWYTVIYRENVAAEAEALSFRDKYSGSGINRAVPGL